MLTDMTTPTATDSTTETESTTETTSAPPSQTAEQRESPTETPAAEQSDGGKKPLKVPESLKPKPTAVGKEPPWVSSRLSHYAAERKEHLARIAELEAAQNRQQPSSPSQDAPKEEDYENYKEFLIAAAKYDLKKEQAAQQKAEQAKQYQAYQDAKRSEFETHAAPILEQVPEFWEAITDPSLPITDVMAEAVMELGEMAPYTMLWLASHRQEAAKMYRLPPRAATVAIGRLAFQLEQELKAEGGQSDVSTLPSTPQPKPVPQIRGGSPGNMDQSPSDKDDTRTWMLKEAERMRKRTGNPNLRVYMPK